MIAEGADAITAFLASHRLHELFIEELGWDRASESFLVSLDGDDYQFDAIANKRGFLTFACQIHRTILANRGRLRLLQKAVSRHYHEHILIFYSEEPAKQVWQWSTVGEDGRRRRHREHPFFSNDPPALLVSRLELLRFSFGEEASATLVDAISRVRNALDVSSELDLFARFPSYATQSDALAVRMRCGDEEAFEEFVLFHERLAKKASRMLYHWVGLNEEDAAQIAILGVIEAARRFDPAKGYQFSTYASYWIRQQCQRYGVNEGMLIRFPSYIFWPAYKFEFQHRRLIATLGDKLQEQDVDEALSEFGLEKAHWDTYCAARDAVRFTDLDWAEFEEIRARTTTDELPIDHLIQDEKIQIVMSEMMDLRERDCQIIGARYGLVHDEMTLQECADVLGLTRERVRQIQARGEDELRIALRYNYPELFDIECDTSSKLDQLKSDDVSEEIVVWPCPSSDAFPTDSEIDAASVRGRPLSILSAENQCDATTCDDENYQSFDEPQLANSTNENEAMSQWVFARLSGAAVRRDPQETELFKTEDAGEGEYSGTDALVREVIQNSMDAGIGDGPVRVRFSLHGNDSLPASDRIASYFGRLKPGLTYRDVSFDRTGVPQLSHGYLVCEDFGTRGLGGDPYLATDPPDGVTGEDFFWFWRNIGRSGKTGDDLGRWGLGKTVYRAASRVGCMLGLTVRHSDGKKLLMGQAVLKIHKHEAAEYAPEGFWCCGCNEADTPLPIEHDESLAVFASEWKLSREDEPGLSVVVPYVADELKTESILRLAAVNFFLPIVQKRLVVEIAGNGLPGGQAEYRVDDQTIESVCEKLSWTGKARQKLSAAPPVKFAKRCLDPQAEIVSTKLLGESRIPAISDEAFDTETLTKLRQKFADEELVAIRVQSALPKKAGGHEIGELKVFLQRTDVNDRFESYYVREGMTITRLNSKPSMRGTRALVTVDPGPLASLLGDTEGPSHVSWDTSNDERPNRVWKAWKGRVKFFAKIVDSLVELLTPPPDKADFDLLSDFFSIEQLESPQRTRKPKPDSGRTKDFAPPEPSPRWYRMHGKEGGFQICDSNQLPTPVGATLRVSVAYDMPSGNPMKHWSPFDFDFRKKNGPIKVTGKGVIAGTKGGNVIELKIEKDDFSLNARGFDIHRDLIVRIDEVQEEQEQTEDADEVAS